MSFATVTSTPAMATPATTLTPEQRIRELEAQLRGRTKELELAELETKRFHALAEKLAAELARRRVACTCGAGCGKGHAERAL